MRLMDQNDEIATHTAKLFAQELESFEKNGTVTVDGHTMHLTVSASPCPVRRGTGILFAIENFTKQYYYQKALKDAIGQAERANKAKTKFLGHMTHELRTPLSGVIGIVDLIMDT
ncbi:hypothetical protein SARC_15254, partial [Sphaeroforma arctica JP610]